MYRNTPQLAFARTQTIRHTKNPSNLPLTLVYLDLNPCQMYEMLMKIVLFSKACKHDTVEVEIIAET